MQEKSSSSSPSISRRSLLARGSAIAGGMLATGHAVLGQDSKRQLPDKNGGLPVTIDFSGLVAGLSSGIRWIAEGGPVLELDLADIPGHRQLVTFVGQSNRRTPPEEFTIAFEFDDQHVTSVNAVRQSIHQGKLDVVSTGLAIYKIGKAFDVWKYRNNRFEQTDQQLHLSGGLSFSWFELPEEEKNKQFSRFPTVNLNVGNLLASPIQGETTKHFSKRQKNTYAIPKYFWDRLPVTQSVAVTDDGLDIYNCSLDVKELLGISNSKGNKKLGERISESHISTVLTIADWLLYRKTVGTRNLVPVSKISGQIGIAFSI